MDIVLRTESRAERNTLIRYNSFIKNLNGKSINEYFNVELPIITYEQITPINYKLTCKHTRVYPTINQLNLPYDLIKHIKSYIEVGFISSFHIEYTKDTPFRAPLWSIIRNNSLNLKKNTFWEEIVNMHNIQYKYDWTPSIYMEKDILCFIERILYKLHKINID